MDAFLDTDEESDLIDQISAHLSREQYPDKEKRQTRKQASMLPCFHAESQVSMPRVHVGEHASITFINQDPLFLSPVSAGRMQVLPYERRGEWGKYKYGTNVSKIIGEEGGDMIRIEGFYGDRDFEG